MIHIGPVALNDGLDWADEADTQAVRQWVRRRADGGLAVYPQALAGGRPITLEARPDSPITYAQWMALEALAAVPGAIYALAFDLRPEHARQVMFRHQEPPALSLRLLLDYADPIDTDLVVGQIKLMVVV
ncbi:hypothetical protein [Thiococcus pfennigii]|uniref:hypothetical protein n=1 Tax=Thiococcus pfennigii TaxID=1057 RepID=UPI0019046200|nr:hypothetical protein [Thiococcus pfennigii]MBK1699733.1 hypothetical protein [Thiococcus pfennigii]